MNRTAESVQVLMSASFTGAIRELDRILSRVCRNDSRLVLERESAKHWIVVDRANDDEVMIRATDFRQAVDWGRAFVVQNPGAAFDELALAEAWIALHSFRVGEPSGALVEGTDGAGHSSGGSPTRHLVAVPDEEAS